jgi:hypothetical protein
VATLKRMKTLLLGLVVILITFTIFVALPAQLPPYESMSCRRVMLGCTYSNTPPLNYDTWMWLTPEQPDYEEWKKALMHIEYTDNILNGLRRSLFDNKSGGLNILVDPKDDNRIIISGYLQYGHFPGSENPKDISALLFPFPETQGVMPYRTINLSILSYYEENSEVENINTTTDINGFFITEIEFKETPECYTISVGYDGEGLEPGRPVLTYLPCNDTYTTCKPEFVFKEPGVPWWVWLIVGLVVIAIGFLIYWYFKHRSERASGLEPLPPAEEIEIPEIIEKKEGDEAGGDLLRIEIGFPDIAASLTEPLPAVWGVSEPITVQVRLKDSNGKILPSQPCNVDFGDGETVQAISDGEGYIRLEHLFNTKDEYAINCLYQDSKTGKEISSWRKIRIVEYREEMVRLFNEMLETLNIRNVRIEPEMTAREVEVLLEERLKGVSSDAIRKIVAGFEEANYSVHPVTRESYVAMYPAVREVLDYGG